MIDRARSRVAFGLHMSDFTNVQHFIAQSRIEIDQARLLVLDAAWKIDKFGPKGARSGGAAVKVAVPALAIRVIDRAIEVFEAAGVSGDTPLACFYAWDGSSGSLKDPMPTTAGLLLVSR